MIVMPIQSYVNQNVPGISLLDRPRTIAASDGPNPTSWAGCPCGSCRDKPGRGKYRVRGHQRSDPCVLRCGGHQLPERDGKGGEGTTGTIPRLSRRPALALWFSCQPRWKFQKSNRNADRIRSKIDDPLGSSWGSVQGPRTSILQVRIPRIEFKPLPLVSSARNRCSLWWSWMTSDGLGLSETNLPPPQLTHLAVPETFLVSQYAHFSAISLLPASLRLEMTRPEASR